LTEELVELEAPLRLIEIDPLLIARLEERFEGRGVEIVHGDATVADLPDDPFRAAGNLPYNVATPIIRRIVRAPGCRRAVFMVQREVADRFVARPGDPDYGFLTLVTRLWATAEIILKLGPGSFRPRPKVSSAVVRFDVRDPGLKSERSALERILSRAFGQRRKKLSNNLEGFDGLTKETIERALEAAGLSPDVRAEQLDLHQFDELTTLLRS
ncbi:MAG: 16S rRNA (adenine(1518)-N(6)/adenine(1519)-N(6))-dimethyltransferase RsmA, partial [Thermoanaerobaculia bacterium]|nr:16S rRNA (adenine(1518)-N(6)/adenine(1519)-N(6))-dimethyltransferase RsmA [Thermoanaerobaculia bacterium]